MLEGQMRKIGLKYMALVETPKALGDIYGNIKKSRIHVTPLSYVFWSEATCNLWCDRHGCGRIIQ